MKLSGMNLFALWFFSCIGFASACVLVGWQLFAGLVVGYGTALITVAICERSLPDES